MLTAETLSAARQGQGLMSEITLMLEAFDARLQCAEGRGLEPLRNALDRLSSSFGPQNPETLRCARALADELSCIGLGTTGAVEDKLNA